MRNQVFVSYSHHDKKWLDELRVHLKPLIRDEQIQVWDDDRIRAGQLWREEIRANLAAASVVVLLVSPEFLASDFIADEELPQILSAARRAGVTILWVAVRASSYAHTKIEPYHAANDPETPLASLRRSARDRVLVEISEQIRRAAMAVGPEIAMNQSPAAQGEMLPLLAERFPVFPTVAARLPRGRFFDEPSRKSGIAIHHTVGGTALSTLKWWTQSPSAPAATAYVIERDGTIFEAFHPSAWAYQFGLPWSARARTAFERRFIGINLASEGGLIESDDGFYAFDRISNPTQVRAADVFDFGGHYRGYRYFIRYPEPQVEALVQLINRLCDDYRIPRRVPGGFLDYYGEQLAAFKGVVGHAMVRGDKSDPAPDRAFWERVVRDCNLKLMQIRPARGNTSEALFQHNADQLAKMNRAAAGVVSALLDELGRAGRATYIRLKNPAPRGHAIDYQFVQGDRRLVGKVAKALGFKRVTARRLEVHS